MTTSELKKPLSQELKKPSVQVQKTQYPKWLNDFSQKIVLGAFQAMQEGALHLTLPSGEKRQLGQLNSSQQPGYHASIQINNADCFSKIVFFGHIGFAEAYMDGDWETESIKEVIAWGILNVDTSPVLEGSATYRALSLLNALGTVNRFLHNLRSNSKENSKTNIHEHYDLSNDFFTLFLDKTMTYSSARFTYPEQSLADAQIAKYDALCRKLRLQPNDHILEIGTGWGGFAEHAVLNYGCRVTTTTISDEQAAYARERFTQAGIADRVELLVEDYRNLTGQYDKIVSIEMLEAVGEAYFDTYFRQCEALLKPNGLLGLQMILCPDSRYALLKNNVDFIQKYIFPGSLLPSIRRMNQAMERSGTMFLHELEDLGPSYAETLSRWNQQFNQHEWEILALGFDERFLRKWNYYFQYCQAAFESRNITVAQAIYTRPNNPTLSAAIHY